MFQCKKNHNKGITISQKSIKSENYIHLWQVTTIAHIWLLITYMDMYVEIYIYIYISTLYVRHYFLWGLNIPHHFNFFSSINICNV